MSTTIKQLNFQITRATNGWVVTTFDPRGGHGFQDMLVVPEDGDLAGAIAAALVASKLQMADAQSTEQALMIDRARHASTSWGGSKIFKAQPTGIVGAASIGASASSFDEFLKSKLSE